MSGWVGDGGVGVHACTCVGCSIHAPQGCNTHTPQGRGRSALKTHRSAQARQLGILKLKGSGLTLNPTAGRGMRAAPAGCPVSGRAVPLHRRARGPPGGGAGACGINRFSLATFQRESSVHEWASALNLTLKPLTLTLKSNPTPRTHDCKNRPGFAAHSASLVHEWAAG